MPEQISWPTRSIRINPDALHKARVGALAARKTLGHWLEEAIQDKIEREISNDG